MLEWMHVAASQDINLILFSICTICIHSRSSLSLHPLFSLAPSIFPYLFLLSLQTVHFSFSQTTTPLLLLAPYFMLRPSSSNRCNYLIISHSRIAKNWKKWLTVRGQLLWTWHCFYLTFLFPSLWDRGASSSRICFTPTESTETRHLVVLSSQ